jgi:molybdopterin-guanine dinucleotide biosynthesis protein
MTESHKKLALVAIEEMKERLIAQIELMEPNYSEKKRFYDDVKQEFEALDSQMSHLIRQFNETQDAINVLNGMVLKPNEEVVIIGRKKSSVKRVKWLEEIVRTLTEANKPLLFEELWQLLEKDTVIIEGYKGAVQPLRSAKMAVLSNMKEHIDNPKQTHQKIIAVYNGKYFILPSWVDETGKLKSIEHARQFNHAKVKKIV